jgi:hypothetical protein
MLILTLTFGSFVFFEIFPVSVSVFHLCSSVAKNPLRPLRPLREKGIGFAALAMVFARQ